MFAGTVVRQLDGPRNKNTRNSHHELLLSVYMAVVPAQLFWVAVQLLGFRPRPNILRPRLCKAQGPQEIRIQAAFEPQALRCKGAGAGTLPGQPDLLARR